MLLDHFGGGSSEGCRRAAECRRSCSSDLINALSKNVRWLSESALLHFRERLLSFALTACGRICATRDVLIVLVPNVLPLLNTEQEILGLSITLDWCFARIER